jgi:hypothetical protein
MAFTDHVEGVVVCLVRDGTMIRLDQYRDRARVLADLAQGRE